jgi:hypothetical protein
MAETPEEVAAGVWCIRERTEHEAAALFELLARDLEASRVPDELTSLARRCADDERDHAEHCRRIIDALDLGRAPLPPRTDVGLGPDDLARGRCALYTSVALGCVTESLSTALLIEMRPHVTHEIVREGLDVIVRDEVRHARLGWAHLAHAATRGDVSWLAPHVPKMLRAALPIAESPETEHDLRGYGILRRADVHRICAATIDTTIRPGFALHGVVASWPDRALLG